MSKNFSDKVREEIQNFASIYADFRADYDANSNEIDKNLIDPEATVRYQMRDPWGHLFHAPIESIGVNENEVAAEDPPAKSAYSQRQSQTETLKNSPDSTKPEAEKLLAKLALQDAQLRSARPNPTIPSEVLGLFLDRSLSQNVLDTVRRLRLNALRLGGISTNDWRVSRALTLGLLSVADLEPLYSKLSYSGGKRVTRESVGGGDPFFWRTLLEVFCRAFLAETGRPKEWPAKRTVSLAFDLVEIDETYFKDTERSNRKLFKKLREREPYASKYWDSDKGKWKVSLNAVNKLMKDIKPKDDILLLLERARIDHEPQFFAEVDKRFPSRRKPKNLAELNKILDSVLTDDQA